MYKILVKATKYAPPHRYTRACYQMLYLLDEAGKNTWATSVKILLNKYGFGMVWLQQGVGNIDMFLSQFKMRLEDVLCQEWNTNINNSSKLSVFCTFKSVLEAEIYLSVLNILKYRGALARFRCSGHRLAIESGRYENILLENRTCVLCEKLNVIVIEDEYHFLLFCPTFQQLRETYINKKYWDVPTFQLFIELMSSSETNTITSLSCFIYKAERLRNSLLLETH